MRKFKESGKKWLKANKVINKMVSSYDETTDKSGLKPRDIKNKILVR